MHEPSRGKRQRVLIVDDSEQNRELIRALLGGEVELEEAHDGPEALRLAASPDIDLVLLDVMMPGISGYDVCRELRAMRGNEHLPILLLTSLTAQEERVRGFDAGADDFITKPIDTVEFKLRVRAFLRARRLYWERQALLDELNQLHDLKDDLATLLVHDLRNPLTGLMAHLHLLDEPDLSEESRESLEAAQGASQRLKEMIDDLLQVRILEENALDVVRLHQPVAGIVADAVETMEGAARAKGLTIVTEAADTHQVACEASLVRRAMENLISNAIKHGLPGSRVMVQASGTTERVDVAVSDEGAGIPEEHRSLLFSKFGTTELRRGGRRSGHGLGLYLVSLVMRAHGGTVRVDHTTRIGTRVVMTFPRPGLDP